MKHTKTPQRAWREVDLHALRRNFFTLRAAAPHARICSVLKANAYGHGAARLSPLYEAWGASALAFATAEEAYEARQTGVKCPIFILGHTDARLAPDLAAAGILPTIHSPDSAAELSSAAVRAGALLPVQIKVDTGMGRLGFVARAGREGRCVRAILSAARLPNLRAVGMFTHFSSADECGVGVTYTKEQLWCFLVVRNALAQAGLPLLAHAANSAAALAYPASHLDMIRPGLSLYGIHPFGTNPMPEGRGLAPAALYPALSVRATVAQIKWVKKGKAIGYGRTFVAPKSMRVATLAIGYADGLSRRQGESGGGVEATLPKKTVRGATHAPHQNRREAVFLPFVGRISMDQCTVDATAAPWLCMGDAVTVLGGRGRVSFPTAATREGTIPYELLTRLSPRLPTVYIGH